MSESPESNKGRETYGLLLLVTLLFLLLLAAIVLSVLTLVVLLFTIVLPLFISLLDIFILRSRNIDFGVHLLVSSPLDTSFVVGTLGNNDTVPESTTRNKLLESN